MQAQRESMTFDVVVVGAGPAGLSTAIRLMQLAQQTQRELSVCIVEKGSEVGAHILSGAVFEPRALNELFPDWRQRGAPLHTPVDHDDIYYFPSDTRAIKLPAFACPKTMHNQGNYVVSAAELCRWLAKQAESLGVEIFPGFAAAELLFGDAGEVAGVITGDMGVDSSGKPKAGFMAGMELHARYTVFAEGCRGHLGKQLIARYKLSQGKATQHYAIGFKEVWDVSAQQHVPGKVVHSAGWPLSRSASGGGFLYHGDNNQVMVGLIVDLNYGNPHLDPFSEFQRFKHHPVISQYLMGGKRVAYGARAICKGGLHALPKMSMPGALLVGCDAGTLNFSKIKGLHMAMKSGMLAAETLSEALTENTQGTPNSSAQDLVLFGQKLRQSWLYDELYQSRNFGAALHRFGELLGGAFNTLDQNVFKGKLPFTLRDNTPDHAALQSAKQCNLLHYSAPDNQISFDRLSSVYLSNTNHEEDQPCHLKLTDTTLPVAVNLPKYNEPAQRYCPAAVYEIVEDAQGVRLQINSQNCIHCKACDIKDPAQNITWVPPEGGGGPNYGNM